MAPVHRHLDNAPLRTWRDGDTDVLGTRGRVRLTVESRYGGAGGIGGGELLLNLTPDEGYIVIPTELEIRLKSGATARARLEPLGHHATSAYRIAGA